MQFLRDKYFLLLGVIVLIAAGFALQNVIYQTAFGYDMARDAFEAHSIFPGMHIKILGPGTDIKGLNHGVLWYYLLALPYFVAGGDPQGAVIFFFLLTFATVPLVWLLSYKLFHDRIVAFIAVVLYVFSPLLRSFGSWMSNPVPGLLIAPVLLLVLWSYLKKKDYKKAFLLGICFGILIQANLANLLFLLLLPLYLLIFRQKPTLKEICSFLASLAIMLFSYMLVELRFGFRGVKGILEFLHGHSSGSSGTLNEILLKFLDLFSVSVLPIPYLLIGVFLCFGAIVIFRSQNKYFKQVIFLVIWIFNIVLFRYFNTGISYSSFVFGPSIAAAVILFSFMLVRIFRNIILLSVVVLLIVVLQISLSQRWIDGNTSPLTIQKSNNVWTYKQAVDYTYVQSEGKPFIITTVTNPLFINTTWAYLYEFYGKKKYGMLPFFAGRSQAGYLGSLPEKQFGTAYRFLIIESQIGVPYIYLIKAKYEEDRVGDLVEEKKFGDVIVQKRLFHENKPAILIPDQLKSSPVLYE